MTPPHLCAYCGNDAPPDTPCPHCQRVPRGVKWTRGPVRRIADPLVQLAGTLLGIFGLVAIIGAIARLAGNPFPLGLLALLSGVSVVCVLVLVYAWRRTDQRAEWSFGTSDGWSGMARFALGGLEYAMGVSFEERDAVPCARPPEACAVLDSDSMHHLGPEDRAHAQRELAVLEDPVLDRWGGLLATFAGVAGVAARGRIALYRQDIEITRWERHSGSATATLAHETHHRLLAAPRDTEGTEHGVFERALVDGVRRLSARGDVEGNYRVASTRGLVSLRGAIADANFRERDEPLPKPTPPERIVPADVLIPALRAFVESDRDLARRLYFAIMEPDDTLS